MLAPGGPRWQRPKESNRDGSDSDGLTIVYLQDILVEMLITDDEPCRFTR